LVLKEPELFEFLKEFYYPDLEKSESKFATFDCLSRKQRLYMELKSRNKHYDDLIIEKIKYEAIRGAAYFLGYSPLYVNSTPDGVWSFDLNQMKEPEWEDRWLPQNTEFNYRGNKTKVVGYLHIKDGKKL
jgi:hypothetical protein